MPLLHLDLKEAQIYFICDLGDLAPQPTVLSVELKTFLYYCEKALKLPLFITAVFDCLNKSQLIIKSYFITSTVILLEADFA